LNDLKNKITYGLIWNFVERFFNTLVQFTVGIVLARILDPKEFGLMGMLAIFISLSQVLINSGLNSAIIRKKTASQKEYSTVFVFNILSSLFFFILLVLFSDAIGAFYEQPILKEIIIVLAIGLVIESFGGIHLAKLQKEMNFKIQTKISFIASLTSGAVAIVIAVLGHGIWALVALHIVRITTSTALIWILVKWKPNWHFDKEIFKDLYHFGSRLLLSGFIDTVYNKGFYLLIGKLYTPSLLGFYNRGERFQSLISENISGWIVKVSYPLFSQIKDPIVLKKTYRKIIKNVMFITFIIMFGLAATAESLIVTLLGEKWMDSVIYLQLLVFVGMLYPIQSLNTDVLKVFGRSDLFLKLVVIKKSIAIPVVIITAFISIKIMILGMILVSILSYIINVYWSSKFIDYKLKEQLKDIFPLFLIGLINGIIVYFIGKSLETSAIITLAIQVLSGFFIVVIYAELTKQTTYLEIKKTVLELLNTHLNKI